MIKSTFITLLLFFSLLSFSQEKKIIIDTEQLSEEQLSNISSIVSQKGWVLIQDQGENFIINYSNKDYRLLFSITCKESSQKPQFLIEYSDNYRDGDYGGIDFLSSKDDDREINFLLDGKSFQNPFKNFKKTEFNNFIEILKKAKILTINVYDTNDLTNKPELNRSIDFKLENGELLNYPVNCE